MREAIEAKKFSALNQRVALIGHATIRFTINADGEFQGVGLSKSSGYEVLDAAALASVHEASGIVKRPQATGTQRLATSAVIKYQYGL